MRINRALAFMCMPAMALAQTPAFTPIDTPKHQYTGGWEHFVGGGVSGFDCDGDGLLEIYAAGGESPAQLFRNQSDANVKFVADTPSVLALTGVTGSYPIDIDSDGYLDLVVLRVGENAVLRGLGECQFEDFPGIPAFEDRWTTAFSATWEAGQTLPTLAFGNYVDRSDPNGPFEACDSTVLMRPDGEAYGAVDLLNPGHCALSMLFSDWNRAGRADLRISNDRHYYVRDGQEQMWAMEAQPRLFGPEDGWLTHRLWGMGIASRDITGDGLPEVYLSSIGDQKLQLRDVDSAGPTFENARFDRGVTAHQPYTGGDGRPSTGWHVVFGDVQNDGRDDIFVAKGNVDQMPGAAMDDPNNLLVQGADGRFQELGEIAGLAHMARGRGAVLADFNMDGLLDLAVVNRRADMQFYQNTTSAEGGYVHVQLVQQGANRNAVGAWIELDADGAIISREITVGGGHAGGVLAPEHFGLGNAQSVKARVIWPDGQTSNWQVLEIAQVNVLTRP